MVEKVSDEQNKLDDFHSWLKQNLRSFRFSIYFHLQNIIQDVKIFITFLYFQGKYVFNSCFSSIF